MIKSVAVVLGQDGRTTSFFEQASINVYVKENEKWDLIKEIPLNIDRTKGIKDIRESLMETTSQLGETKIIAGREISGLPYNILDMAGFDIYEIDGVPEGFLDFAAENKEEKSSTDEGDGSALFVETGIEGNFFINLKKAQNEDSSLSTKQILFPFLKSTRFHELKIVCSHIPPWFETGIDKLGMKFEATRISLNEYEVVISNKVCNE